MEDAILDQGFRAGLAPCILAHYHQRSVSAVQQRLASLGWRRALEALAEDGTGIAGAYCLRGCPGLEEGCATGAGQALEKEARLFYRDYDD